MAANDIGRVYAASLADIGQEKGILPQLEEELKFVSGLIKEDSDFRVFLVSPGFSKERKKEFIDKVFGKNLSDVFINFLKVIIENDRQSALSDIYEALTSMIDDVNNRQRVTIITPSGCDKAVSERIVQELKSKLKKDIILDEKVDNSILGGIIIKIGDLVIDGSLVKDLKNIRKKLIISKVRSEVAYED